MSKRAFVFVVCGLREHIDTMHFSLQYLKKYSACPVYVVTDSTRNEIAVEHDTVIDVRTPESFNHHQASIYLKTAVHRFLPPGSTYCYLDTDVIALSEECDRIFDELIPPVRFAPDHCRARKFSAYAVNCGCLASREKDRAAFQQFADDVKASTVTDPRLEEKARELQHEFDQLKNSPLRRYLTAFRYFTSYPVFRFSPQFRFNKRTRTWHLSTGETVMYEMDIKKMQKATGLRYNKWTQKWYNSEGEDIWQDECNHLVEEIRRTFGTEVKEKNWQHWNGGVFLFNDSGHEFLEAWHRKTMHIFTLPQWKTRDQGTLIATAWEFNLRDHPVLSKKWNFIADYYNKGLALDAPKNALSDDGFVTSYVPAFVHVYHNWKKKDWPLWQWIESRLQHSSAGSL